MSMRSSALAALSCVVSFAVVGCANDGWADDDDALDGDDPPAATSSELKNRARWQPPASSLKGSYEGAGPYNGGKGCAKGMKPGTKAVGELVDERFPSTRYEGYACRPNTANKSQLSVHGTGRALDIFASPTVGDEVANHLVKNAQSLGVQLVIWNRTIWQIRTSGASSKAYGGPNPHTDHVHAEVSSKVAASGPSSSQGPGPDDEDDVGPAETGGGGTPPSTDDDRVGASCTSDGQCNPGNDGSGSICSGGRCIPGCRADYHCPGVLVCVAGQCN